MGEGRGIYSVAMFHTCGEQGAHRRLFILYLYARAYSGHFLSMFPMS